MSSSENKNPLPAWPLITAGILTFLYLFALHPISGVIGGALFMFLGFWVPNFVNILLSYWLATCVFRRFSYKTVILTALLSFIFGLNVFLLSPFISAPKDISVNVIKPLTPPTKAKSDYAIFDIKTVFETNATIAPFLVTPQDVEGNEGCGCMYFYNIAPVYSNSSIKGMFNDYLNTIANKYPITQAANNSHTRYIVTTNIKQKNGKSLVELNIQDNHGGNVTISAFYSQYLYVSSMDDYQKRDVFPGKNFTVSAFNVLLYHNFWAMYLGKYFKTPMVDKHILLNHPEIWRTSDLR